MAAVLVTSMPSFASIHSSIFPGHQQPLPLLRPTGMAPSKFATMCRALCAVTPTYLLARFPTSAISELDEEDSADDDDDEWGILHAPTQTCRVQFVTESHGLQVSLVLAVTSCYHAPRLQHTRVVWTFSSVDNHSTRPVRFVQAPMFAVSELVSFHFGAYVSDRLEFAAHRHHQWTEGSRLCWTPRLATLTSTATSIPAATIQELHSANTNNQDAEAYRASTSHQNVNEEAHQLTEDHLPADVEKSARKMSSLPRMQPLDVNPRYMDYEWSASYCSRRRTNAERRCAFESSPACKKDSDLTSTTSPVDSWEQMRSRIKQASSRLFAFEMDPAWQDRCKHSKARRAKLHTAS